MQTLFLSILHSKFYLRGCWCALIPNQCIYNDFVPLEAFRKHTHSQCKDKHVFSDSASYKPINSLRPSDAYMFKNDLSPRRRQAITWTSAGILSIVRVGTILGEVFFQSKFKHFYSRKSSPHHAVTHAQTQPCATYGITSHCSRTN